MLSVGHCIPMYLLWGRAGVVTFAEFFPIWKNSVPPLLDKMLCKLVSWWQWGGRENSVLLWWRYRGSV